jgi:hypothetical protein
VENLAESLWMCSDGPGSAPIQIPKGVPFFEREQERDEEEDSLRVGKKRSCMLDLQLTTSAPPVCGSRG